MKTILKKTLSLLPFIGGVFMANSQNLDYLPQAKRDSILISIAKEAVLRYGPGYYREYKTPVIERGQIPVKGTMNPTGENAGKIYYRVTFLYDKTQEVLAENFAAIVGFREGTSSPVYIRFGNERARFIPEKEWKDNAVVEEQTPYETMIFPIYDWNNPEKKEPINIDELKQKGYEDKGDQWVKTKQEVPPNIDILKREGYEEINGQWVKTKKKVPAQVK
jgi:hypothetical protein